MNTLVLGLAVFAQESAFRDMSELERKTSGVELLNVQGFNFEEFVQLVAYHHSKPDRNLLLSIYRRVTAGRSAGLFAKLALLLASSISLEEMKEISEQSAEAILPYAERQRFARVSDGARPAAEKLICFALPYSCEEAEQVFPKDNINLAIKELLELGVLNPRTDGLFEMHETVRAGLEANIAQVSRQRTHCKLANWYRKQNVSTAEILHLSKADLHKKGFKRARNIFLKGKHWRELESYVINNNLVSPEEVVNVVAEADKPIDSIFLLPKILREIGKRNVAEPLFNLLREQPERFANDYQG